jgi:iron(III) transport system permease protein
MVGDKRTIDLFPYAVGGVTVIVLGLFLIYPIGKMVLFSFVEQGQRLAVSNLTLVNFENFIAGANSRNALWNSLSVAGLVTLFSTLLALPAAYALARVRMRFRGLIMALMVIPIVAPPFIGAYAWVILLGRNGIITHFLDSWLGIELPSIYGLFGIVLALSLHYFPYVFLFVQGAMMASDPYIEESARIMGASRWRIVRTITFPLLVPTIGAAALIVLVKALGNFGVPAILGGEFTVLPTLIYYQINGFFNLNAAAAIAMVNVGITLIAVLILARVNQKRRFVTVTGTTRRSARHEERGARIAANVYVWGLLAAALAPQLVIVVSSFAETWGATLLPTKYGFSVYAAVWEDIAQPIINSLFLAGGATALCVIFGTLSAYAVTRDRIVGKWAVDMTIMLPFVLPGIVAGVAFLTTFNSGMIVLTGTATILILAYFVRRIAYMFRAVSAAIEQVDDKLEEASSVCGATWAYTMRRITVPLVAPGILAGGILVFTTLITEISITVMLFSARWKTISITIFEFLTSDEIAEASAVGTIAILLTLLLVFGASKLIGKSMADLFR